MNDLITAFLEKIAANKWLVSLMMVLLGLLAWFLVANQGNVPVR